MLSTIIIQAAREAPPTDNWRIKTEKLSEKDLRKIIENNPRVNWEWISEYQILSEGFIKEFRYKVNWYYISRYQTLSERFIREFKYSVHWSCISVSQSLSEDFIREFLDKVYWEAIKNMSDEFRKEFKCYHRK